ncbi:MAG: beta-galactosidase [bacterium]|nr:beta-galactosidase [bacterium]
MVSQKRKFLFVFLILLFAGIGGLIFARFPVSRIFGVNSTFPGVSPSSTPSTGVAAPVASPTPLPTTPTPPESIGKTPRGVFVLIGRAATPAAVLANPSIAGLVFNRQWELIETSKGTYDWGGLDSQISQAAAAGKMVRIGIAIGGQHTPKWVFDEGVTTISFIDRNEFHQDTYNTSVEIPLFWDPTYLALKKAFIEVAGARYNKNPDVHLVTAACVNPNTDDWVLPARTAKDIQDWKNAGYSSDKIIDACKQIMDATVAAFPNKTIFMAVGPIPAGLDSDPDYAEKAVLEYARTTYPGRFLFGNGALSAKTPDPEKDQNLPARWQLLYAHRPNIGLQMLWTASDTNSCRMNARKSPCDPVEVLRTAVMIGAHYQSQLQEIYLQDALNPALQAVIKEAATILAAVPAP